MYHSVADPTEDPYNITVSPDRLDAQLLESLERAAGPAVRALVRIEPDSRIAAVVSALPPTPERTRRQLLSAGNLVESESLDENRAHGEISCAVLDWRQCANRV